MRTIKCSDEMEDEGGGGGCVLEGKSPGKTLNATKTAYIPQSRLVGGGIQLNNPSGINSAFSNILLPLKGSTKVSVKGTVKRRRKSTVVGRGKRKSSKKSKVTSKRKSKSKTIVGEGKRGKRKKSGSKKKKQKKASNKSKRKS